MLDALSSFGAYLVDDAAGTYLGKDGKTNINYEQGVAEEARRIPRPPPGPDSNSSNRCLWHRAAHAQCHRDCALMQVFPVLLLMFSILLMLCCVH